MATGTRNQSSKELAEVGEMTANVGYTGCCSIQLGLSRT